MLRNSNIFQKIFFIWITFMSEEYFQYDNT